MSRHAWAGSPNSSVTGSHVSYSGRCSGPYGSRGPTPATPTSYGELSEQKYAAWKGAWKRWFIDALIDLFDQESEYVIDVIEDCREEMRETADRYKDEADQLRATSRMFEEQRESRASPSLSPKRSISRMSAPSRLLYLSERDGPQDSVRSRQRRRRMVTSDDDNRCTSSLSVPSLPDLTNKHRNISPSARGSRSLPATPAPEEGEEEKRKKIHEETRAIMQNMNARESQAERERERQQERLERMRRQKRFLNEDRTTQALKLLEKALEMDKALASDKERQGAQLRSKLDEMKRKRGQKKEVEFVEVVELQHI